MSFTTDLAVAAVAVAAGAFFILHIVKQVINALGAKRRREDWLTTQKELENEIRNGGNIARIIALRRRMLSLQDE